MIQVDYILAGGGLAGSLLAWQLHQLGKRVFIFDREEAASASRVAAGIINPVTGPRFVKDRQSTVYLQAGLSVYRELERRFNTSFLEPLPMVRLFQDPAQKTAWEKRRHEPDYRDYFGSTVAPGGMDGMSAPFGGYHQRHTNLLNISALLTALRDFFAQQGRWSGAMVDVATVQCTTTGVKVEGVTAETLVFCDGYHALANPWFQWLPFNPAKGEILTLHTKAVLPHCAVHAGHWLLPLGAHRFKFGATYTWNDMHVEPTQTARTLLLNSLHTMLPVTASVLEQQAGIRPCTLDTAPFIGRHPRLPALALCNGFGSKGGLLIPHATACLCAHLLHGASLPRAWDIDRYHSRYRD